ncbi:hypothetical protein A2U01_0055930 [Trifolium medium]|uniref:Uncharacterized protein n=1 Tax=Trifolium medium TaxID=97028 RepID=A0A392RG07_9FABA|nr:hypothetical protein [Trifolium medium]
MEVAGRTDIPVAEGSHVTSTAHLVVTLQIEGMSGVRHDT